MDSVYIVLVRWGPEWDGQSLYRTKSKAMFDFMCATENKYNDRTEPKFADFSEELKSELRNKRDEQAKEIPELTPESIEDITLSEAMEWLDSYGLEYNKFPVLLAGTGELTAMRWNY